MARFIVHLKRQLIHVRSYVCTSLQHIISVLHMRHYAYQISHTVARLLHILKLNDPEWQIHVTSCVCKTEVAEMIVFPPRSPNSTSILVLQNCTGAQRPQSLGQCFSAHRSGLKSELWSHYQSVQKLFHWLFELCCKTRWVVLKK